MNNKYTIIKQESIEELNGTGYILKHDKTGARVVVISNEDDNKVFQIGFRTPPKDDTGVPHILEHSVLCGSREFPMKDPFVELVKGSLNTFLNAYFRRYCSVVIDNSDSLTESRRQIDEKLGEYL